MVRQYLYIIYKGLSSHFLLLAMCSMFFLAGCAQAEFPNARTPNIPAVTQPYNKLKGVNEDRKDIMKLPLGGDILVPRSMNGNPLPDVDVGPFELRGETLGGALQLILADYNITMAFETSEGLTRRITAANLHGNLSKVVNKVCSLADLYCAYDDGIITIKETETFVVDLPPFGFSSDGAVDSVAFDQIVTGLESIIGNTPTLDSNARILVYSATHRSNKYAEEYFRRLRKNTALVVFETHIWEVTLDNENHTGINWEGAFSNIGNFDIDLTIPGGVPAGTVSPITITPAFSGSGNLNFETVLEFISRHGAVKTVSQPQITVISGGSASLEVRQSENFISEFTRTPSTTVGVPDTVSTTTDTVDTGLRMTIASAWDKATVYGMLDISLDELLRIENFSPSPDTIIQLPSTTTRSLETQIRVRPGDAILIAGLVTERDLYEGSGPGLLKPLFTTSRSATTRNTELIFMLKPRVIVFTDEDDNHKNKTVELVNKKPIDVDIPLETVLPLQEKEEKPQQEEKVDVDVTMDMVADENKNETDNTDEMNKKEKEKEKEKPFPVLSISPNLLAPSLEDGE